MKRGFTLLEMSIVLVVIGLIVGGIMSGQALLRNAERAAVVSELTKYQRAFIQFHEQYGTSPGDLAGATALWGSAGGGSTSGAGCYTVSNNTSLTCNGDGDGRTIFTAGSVEGDIWRFGERFHAWKHLANAGLIDGRFTGVTASTTNGNAHVAGENAPSSSMKGYAYSFGYARLAVAEAVFYHIRDANDYEFVGHTMSTHHNTYGAHTPRPIAKYIDEKLDDGLPGTGFVRAFINCTTSSDRYAARYDLDATTPCTMVVYMPRSDGSFY